MQCEQKRRENTRKHKNINGAAAVLFSHDSHNSQGKIQNKTHETLTEKINENKKASPMRQNGASLRFELYDYDCTQSGL